MLHIGSIRPGRGVEHAVRSLAGIPKLHFVLVTQTKGEYLDEIRQLAACMGVEERMHVQPALGHENLSTFASEADIGLVSTEHYGNAEVSLPNKLFAYISGGTPVVASSTEAMAAFVSRWGVGRLFEPGDVEALTRAIKDVLRSKDQIAARLTPQSEVQQLFSWAAQERTLGIVYEALKAKRPPFNLEPGSAAP
jgi:glycosyltransferase involved in cell wall biosynthesis